MMGECGKGRRRNAIKPDWPDERKARQKQHTGQNWKTMYGWGKDKFPFRKRKGCDPQKSKPSKLWREVGGKEEDSSHFGNNASRVEASWKMPCGGGGFIPILEKFAPILDFTEKGAKKRRRRRPQNIFGTNIEQRGRAKRKLKKKMKRPRNFWKLCVGIGRIFGEGVKKVVGLLIGWLGGGKSKAKKREGVLRSQGYKF